MREEKTATAMTIASLYPSLDEERRRTAEENLDQYLALAIRIHERVKTDSARVDSGKLTAQRPEVGSEAVSRPAGRIPKPPV